MAETDITPVSAEAMKSETAPRMDWEQVRMHGAPPCFYIEGPEFCGRAESWPGHGNEAFHNFVSLNNLLTRAKGDNERPCSACGDGDTAMEYHSHDPKVDTQSAARRAAERWFAEAKEVLEYNRKHTGDNFADAGQSSFEWATKKLAAIIAEEFE